MECLHCGKPTKRWGKSSVKYCGIWCKNEYWKGHVKATFNEADCAICAKKFVPVAKNNKYCSKPCRREADRTKRTNKPKTKECAVCKTEYTPYTSLDKYCSYHCRVENMKSGRSRRWNEASTLARMGKNNPGFKHGYKVRGSSESAIGMRVYKKSAKAYRQKMLDEHGYLFCERCGKTNARFETHHIFYRSEAPNHPNLHDHCNLIRVCVPCHNHYHKSRENRAEIVARRGLEKIFGRI